MSTLTELDRLDRFDWLVNARNKIQLFMLELLKCVEKGSDYRKRIVPSSNGGATDALKQWNYLHGAAFSLWRAVFLCDTVELLEKRKNPEKLLEQSSRFLLRIVEANTIGFGDELSRSPWTSGYYLNNARFRLNDLKAKHGYSVELTKGISDAVPKNIWDETFDTLEKVFDEFKKRLKSKERKAR